MFSFLGSGARVLRRGPAARVIFFYSGEEGTYVDNVFVTLYSNGIVYIESKNEETSTHLQNCEILWRYETASDERVSKLRLLKDRPREEFKEEHPEPRPE